MGETERKREREIERERERERGKKGGERGRTRARERDLGGKALTSLVFVTDERCGGEGFDDMRRQTGLLFTFFVVQQKKNGTVSNLADKLPLRCRGY